MAKCPNCQNEIIDDFGLVTCAKCGAQVMINFDGQASIDTKHDGPPAGMVQVAGDDLVADSAVKKMLNRQSSVVGQLSEQLSVDLGHESVAQRAPAPESEPPLNQFRPLHEASSPEEIEPNPAPMPKEPDYEEPIYEEPLEPEIKKEVTSDMSDIAKFGNSSMSQAREGSLLFDIYISGIDTADIRSQVREALTDTRFVWDAQAFMARLRNGELRIKDVSAIKSAIIIQRLRSVPVDVRWEQHAIHQP